MVVLFLHAGHLRPDHMHCLSNKVRTCHLAGRSRKNLVHEVLIPHTSLYHSESSGKDSQPHALNLLIRLSPFSRRHFHLPFHILTLLRHRPAEIQLAPQPPGFRQVEGLLDPGVERRVIVVVLQIAAEALEGQGSPEEELVPVLVESV